MPSDDNLDFNTGTMRTSQEAGLLLGIACCSLIQKDRQSVVISPIKFFFKAPELIECV